MKKDFNSVRPSGSKNEPRVMHEVLIEYFKSDEPLPIALRKRKVKSNANKAGEEGGDVSRLFKDIFPDTFLDVNLKVVKRQPGRMIVDECLEGAIIRDGEEHFTFIQNVPVKKVEVRNPHFFKGICVNVVKSRDGILYLYFNHPRFNEDFTFLDFCQKAIEELLLVARLVEKNK